MKVKSFFFFLSDFQRHNNKTLQTHTYRLWFQVHTIRLSLGVNIQYIYMLLMDLIPNWPRILNPQQLSLNMTKLYCIWKWNEENQKGKKKKTRADKYPLETDDTRDVLYLLKYQSCFFCLVWQKVQLLLRCDLCDLKKINKNAYICYFSTNSCESTIGFYH